MSVRRLNLILACLCCLVAAGLVSRTPAQYRFDHWTADTGLPQNIITAIQQTPEGYLWVATFDGLTRFDGVRFTVFNKSITSGLSSNRFTCLYQDAQGDLWAGTEVGVITRYHQGQFITYSTEQGLPKSYVYGLTGDPEGHLWALSGNRVRAWEPATGRFVERDALPFSGNSGRLGWNDEGGFWRVDQTGLHLFAKGAWEHVALPREVDGQIKQVAKEGDGAIWLMAENEQIFRLKDGKLTTFQPQNKERRAALPLTEWRDRGGKIWEMEVVRNLSRKLTIPSSGQAETIVLNTLYEDRDRNLWLGTDGQGLYHIRKQTVTTFSQEEGLIHRNVYPVYEDRAGTIWVGAWEGGLSQIKGGKIANFTTRDGLSGGAVTALCEDRAGRLWIATHTDLQIFEQGRFTSVKEKFTPGPPAVNAIYQDRTGAMWFSTDHGLIRQHDGQSQRYTMQDGLPGESVRVTIDAVEGGVWIGCYGGLMRWQNGKSTTWTDKDGLPGNAVRALYEDPGGVLWIGTYDSGLARFKNGKFTRYTTREGLFNDGVFQILEDGYGNLWMSCNRGIYRVRKQELNEFAAGQRREITSIAFGRNDGMLNVECNGGLSPAGVRSRDGRLWFPTQDGVAMIDPAAVTTNQQPPPVLIEAVLLDRAPIAFRDEVRIQPGQGNLEIQYTALSFANAAYLRFKYRIEGLDHDWVDAGTRRAAFFSYLPPGGYTFKVIAANSDGVWNTEGKSLRITVLPPFYRTWWFLTLAVLSAAGAILTVFQYRITQLERRQAAQQSFARQLLESQEQERRRIAVELHDSLGQNLLVIKNRALLNALTHPDEQAQTQFNEFSDAVSQTLEEVRTISHDLRPPHLDQLGLRTALVAMIEQVAASSPIRFTQELDECDGRFAPGDDITLYRIVQECLNNILKHSGATDALVRLRVDDHRAMLTIRDNGCGFATENRTHVGLGLQGIEERARILGGTPTIDSTPGQGTTVTVRIELKDK